VNRPFRKKIAALAACAAVHSISLPTATAHADDAPVTHEVPPPPPRGDAAHGKALYQGCNACHSIDDNDIGPRHRGVVGRRAGSLEDYNYSPALKSSGLTWDPATLDRWLSNPSALVPGTKMFFKLDSAQDRADVIAYLEELK
jgi:cytochrome c